MCQGGYRDTDREERMDCRVNGEVIVEALGLYILDALKCLDR